MIHSRFFIMLIFLFFLQNLYGSSAFTVTSNVVNSWSGGYQAAIAIKNTGSSASTGWIVEFDLPSSDQKIQNLWNGVINTKLSTPTHIVVNNPAWTNGGVINANGSWQIGMVINKNSTSSAGLNNVKITPTFANNASSGNKASSGSSNSGSPSSGNSKGSSTSSGSSSSSNAGSSNSGNTGATTGSSSGSAGTGVTTPIITSSNVVTQYQALGDKIWAALLKTEQQYQGTVAGGLLVDNQGSVIHSEGIGYGMLIALANNDKAFFTKNVSFMAARLDKFGLMNWNVNTNGTIVSSYGGHYAATDADQDIVYALIQGLQKWPDLATTQINATIIGFNDSNQTEMAPVSKTITYLDLAQQQMYSIWDLEIQHSSDISNLLVLPGDGFGGRPFSSGNFIDVSYFRPTYMNVFQNFYTKYLQNSNITPPLYSSSAYKSGNFTYASQKHDWLSVKTKMYNYILLNMQNTSMGLPSAWSNPISGVPGGMSTDFQYDAVRVFQFVAMDYMQTQNVQAKQILQQMLGYYCYQLQQGATKNSQGQNSYQQFSFPVSLSSKSSANLAWVKNVITPPTDLCYRFGGANGNLCCNPANPMIAESLMIAAHALGSAYQTLEQTCYDYLMSNDGGVMNIPYFAGSLTVLAARFLQGVFP